MLSPTMMLFTCSCFFRSTFSRLQFLGLDGVLDQDQSFFERERFFEEIVGAEFRGADGGLDGSVAGDHDDFGRIVELANSLQSFEAVDAGQPDIEQDHVERGFAQQVEAGLAASDRGSGVAFVGQNAGEGVANSGFVVNDERCYACCTAAGAGVGSGTTGSSTMKRVPTGWFSSTRMEP